MFPSLFPLNQIIFYLLPSVTPTDSAISSPAQRSPLTLSIGAAVCGAITQLKAF